MIYKSSKAQTKVSVMFRLITFFHSAIQMSTLAECMCFTDGLRSTKKVVTPDENTAFLRGKLKCLQNKYNYYDFILIEG
jgi:hypothetical protein